MTRPVAFVVPRRSFLIAVVVPSASAESIADGRDYFLSRSLLSTSTKSVSRASSGRVVGFVSR